jgi:hypothetical protein
MVPVMHAITPHEAGKADQAEEAEPAPIEVVIVSAGAVHRAATAVSRGLTGGRYRPAGRVSAGAGLSKRRTSAPE